MTRFEGAPLKVADFESTDSRANALRGLAALLKVTAPADLRDALRSYLPAAPAPAPVAISPEERKRIDGVIGARIADFEKVGGDVENGAKVFATHCAVCHQIEKKGGLVGPQLDGIGARGVARLSEDILDPNRNVDAHFYLTTVTMKDGVAAAGLVRGESGAVVVLTDIAGTDHRLLKPQIAKRETVPVSLMPPGFGNRFSEAEFRDLLAYLLGKKG